MKRYIFLFIVSFSISTFGQVQTNAPWLDDIDSNNKSVELTIENIKLRAENYFKTIDTDKKGSGYKPYNRWLEHWKTYQTDNGTIMPASKLWEAWEAKKKMESFSGHKTTTVESNWQSIGPFSFIDSGSWGKGQGRVNVIVVDPNNPNTYFVGAPAGGLWKSTDSGVSWTPLTDDLPQIGVSGIAINKNDSNIIYITTGDDDASDSYFVGVMKSTDGGQTWNATGTLPTGPYMTANEIYIDPSNSNKIWVATSSGLYSSVNGGSTWVFKLSGEIKDFKLKPGDPNTIYVVTRNKFYKSTDGGNSFNQITAGLPTNSTRMTIDITPANPEYVYLLSTYTKQEIINNQTYTNNYAFQGVYKSTNSGASFFKTLETDDIFNRSDQGWFDLALGVSDVNPNEVYVGVLNIWKSINGGNNFTQINTWNQDSQETYTHGDIHFLRFYDGVLFAGTDGGVFRSTNNASSFESLTTGLAIGQFYRISASEKSSGNIIGGLQDNGGYVYSSNQWYNYHGADGMDAASNPLDKKIGYSFIQNGSQLYKSVAGESFFETEAPAGESGNWVTPLVADDTGALYAGYSQLYKYFDGQWTKLSNNYFPGKINCIEIDPNDKQNIFVSLNQNLYKSVNSGSNFVNLSTDFDGIEISSIEVNNHNSNIIYITTNGSTGKIYKSIDGGSNWSDITYNLPLESKNVIRHQKYHPNNPIYVGTYLGIYYLDDTLSEWQPFSTNLPNVHITDLEITPLDGVMTASTFGRGIWQSEIPVVKPENDIAAIEIPELNSSVICENFAPTITVKNNGTNVISTVYINYTIDNNNHTVTWNGTINPNDITDIPLNEYLLDFGEHEIAYTVTIDNDTYSDNNSGIISYVSNQSDNQPTKVNPFEDLVTDSWLVVTHREEPDHLWTIGIPNTTQLNAVSSGKRAYITNPSDNYSDKTLSLLYTPCYDLTQVLDPIMKFQMAFDLEPDWDVLYVEYSTDNGLTWEVLGTADDPNWYNSKATRNELTIGKQWTGSDTTLKEYSYDLNALTNEPQISFRFHFESDEAVNAEGVIIDDFVIAGEALGIDDVNLNSARVFPNPANNLVNISWNETYNGDIKLYDITGRLLKTLSVNNKSQISFSTEHYTNGVYLIQFSNENHNLVKKLIIER